MSQEEAWYNDPAKIKEELSELRNLVITLGMDVQELRAILLDHFQRLGVLNDKYNKENYENWKLDNPV